MDMGYSLKLQCVLIGLLFLLPHAEAQSESFPLESVTLEGTSLKQSAVLDITRLKLGAPIDQAAIEAACSKLRDSGLFDSINYKYAPGPKRGYALTLIISDKASLSDAAIDIPGLDEAESWQWLMLRFPLLNHRVPSGDAGQQFVAKEIEEHLGAKLEGQHLVAKLETEFTPRPRTIVSLQPALLPKVAAMSFSGQQEFSSAELAAILQPLVAQGGYTDRHFRGLVELNIRPLYETHGMYRVRFPMIRAEKSSPGTVNVTTVVEEGQKFSLGDVTLTGDNLPAAAMLKAGGFKKGKLANWQEIQQGIWNLEKPLKRTGYFDATAVPQRALHDAEQILDVNITFRMGPLYRFGQLTVVGLSPALEGQVRKHWKLQPGDPFDYDYPRDFFQSFFASVDSRQFKKYDVKMKKQDGNKADFTLIFEPR
jgi:outer membrane protein assembly factor BamA